MLSKLRRRKLKKMFELTDVDGNGLIDRADYRRVLDFLSSHNAWEDEHPKRVKLQKALMQNWESVRQVADLDGDGGVTLDEWMTVWTAFYEALPQMDPGRIPSHFQEVVGLLFDAIDLDDDGFISPADYDTFLKAHGKKPAGKTVFSRLDLNGDGLISRDEAIELAYQFHMLDDPRAVGCWLYGPLPSTA